MLRVILTSIVNNFLEISQSLYFLSSLREGTKEAEEKVDAIWRGGICYRYDLL